MKPSNYFAVIFFILLLVFTCNCNGNKKIVTGDLHEADTLRVVTLYGPTSFFDYRGDTMGIDFENVKRFAEDEGLILDISTKKNVSELIEALKNGEADLAAYPIPSISEFKDEVLHCGHIEISRQVIAQRSSPNSLKDVTELVGKNVYVEKNSKFHYRLENLNEEIGGGINIMALETDTITSEDLLEMVSEGKIDYAVVDSQTASLYKGGLPNLDVKLNISSDQAASWAVGLGLDSLKLKIDNWENRTHSPEFVKEIYKRYYDRALTDDLESTLSYFKKLDIRKGGSVSSYDAIFKRYASLPGYDWQLLAAIAFCESRFNPSVESRFGAFGLMQVMPATAKAMGVDPSALGIPDQNVFAAAKILARFDEAFKNKIPDPQERLKFVVASYNSGPGHIYDSMALAEKIGLDPQKWLGNVSIAALMKSRPEYYNDPVVKHGYFRGRETVDFVDKVMSIYEYLIGKI